MSPSVAQAQADLSQERDLEAVAARAASALIARLEAHIVEAERMLGRLEALLARGHCRSVAPAILARRREYLAGDRTRLTVHRAALYREQGAEASRSERAPGAQSVRTTCP